MKLAEGMRFELTVGVDPLQRFSKPPPSATRPPLRRGNIPEPPACATIPDTAFATVIVGNRCAAVKHESSPTSTLWTSFNRETRGRPHVSPVPTELWC